MLVTEAVSKYSFHSRNFQTGTDNVLGDAELELTVHNPFDTIMCVVMSICLLESSCMFLHSTCFHFSLNYLFCINSCQSVCTYSILFYYIILHLHFSAVFFFAIANNLLCSSICGVTSQHFFSHSILVRKFLPFCLSFSSHSNSIRHSTLHK